MYQIEKSNQIDLMIIKYVYQIKKKKANQI